MRANFINTHIVELVVHIVGNKIADDGVVLSKSCFVLSSELSDLLSNYFLGSFTSDEYYHLYHDTNLNLNEVFSYVSEIFNNPNAFYLQSTNLAKHLYNESVYPNIKEGEFYVALFKGVTFENKEVDAVGIFKTEKKSIFLKTFVDRGSVNIEQEKGIDIKKLDKGCLIFNEESHNGYVVAVVDNTNKNNQAKYWIDDFLHVRKMKDTYTNTENMMSLTKSFVTKELSQSAIISKPEQINLLNKSLQYFQKKELFNIHDFENEVIAHPEIVERFRDFKGEFESLKDISIDEEFQLSHSAIKKQQRSYKKAINLDKKIQIIINGNSNQIEKGKDANGKFYKIYYNEEE
jgi:hypothetical protein